MIIKRYQHIQLLHRVRLVELPTHISQRFVLHPCRPISPRLLIAEPAGVVVPRPHRLGIPTRHIRVVTAFRSRPWASSFSNPSAFSLTGGMLSPVPLLLLV